MKKPNPVEIYRAYARGDHGPFREWVRYEQARLRREAALGFAVDLICVFALCLLAALVLR